MLRIPGIQRFDIFRNRFLCDASLSLSLSLFIFILFIYLFQYEPRAHSSVLSPRTHTHEMIFIASKRDFAVLIVE